MVTISLTKRQTEFIMKLLQEFVWREADRMGDEIIEQVDALLNIVASAQGDNRKNVCKCGEWPKHSPWLHCPWCGERLSRCKRNAMKSIEGRGEVS